MWILIGLCILILLLFAFTRLVQLDDYGPIAGLITVCIAAVTLLAISIPIYRADARTQLAQRDALQQSYNTLRARPLEMATVARDIAAWNAWLAGAQYWNHTQWRWWWPDAVRTAQPIR